MSRIAFYGVTSAPPGEAGKSESHLIQNQNDRRAELLVTPSIASPGSPLALIHMARGLHGRLISAPTPAQEKSRLAREVEGALFAAEANAALCNRARVLFFRIRTHAHMAALRGSGAIRNNESVWLDYDELELLIDGR